MTAGDRSAPRRSLGLLTSRQVQALPSSTVVLLPIGSMEPHGHLPLATDSLIAEAILDRLMARTRDTWLLPTLPYGDLFKYSDWPGAIGPRPSSLAALIEDLCDGLVQARLKRLFVVSGHDENREAVLLALRASERHHGLRAVYCDWLDLAVTVARERSTTKREGHASEIQTSVFMYLFPNHRVDARAAAPTLELRPGDDDLFAPEEGGTVIRRVSQSVGRSHTGDPTPANAELGETVVAHILERAIAIVDRLRGESD